VQKDEVFFSKFTLFNCICARKSCAFIIVGILLSSNSIGDGKVKIHCTSPDSFITNPSKAVSEFTTIFSLIEGILKKTNEASNVDAIQSICGYLPISSSSSKLMFTSEQLKEIDSCSSIQEIIRQLRFHLRWDDHLILLTV